MKKEWATPSLTPLVLNAADPAQTSGEKRDEDIGEWA